MKASGSASGGRDIYLCADCGVYFCYPLPNPEELLTAYDGASDEQFVSQNKFRYKTFKNSFLNFSNSLELSPKKVLVTDIGAAGGVFLHVMKDLGYSARGIEPSSWLAEYGRKNYGVDLIQGDIRDFVPSKERLDIITYWDVLEHLADPPTDLAELERVLKPKSIILISLPSTDTLSFKILGWRWPMHLDVHLFYFNKKSLEALFDSHGFSLIYSSKYPQQLSFGYLLFRASLVLFPFLPPRRLAFLTNGPFNSIPIKYSIGQRVFAFQKR
jgi:SAM-dependent methyltransferase